MTETKAEEIISLLYAIFGFIMFNDGYEKTGLAFSVYAAINMMYAIWLSIKAEKIKRAIQTEGT